MASGKKNYFRHSFFARNNIKLKMLRDEIGVGFYFYFFSLLELCGETSADELHDFYEFHDSTIRSLWGVNLKKSERIAHQMNAVGLLEFKKLEKTFWFKIDNLAKYLGKYTTKNSPNFLSKGKESKVNKSKGITLNNFLKVFESGAYSEAHKSDSVTVDWIQKNTCGYESLMNKNEYDLKTEYFKVINKGKK